MDIYSLVEMLRSENISFIITSSRPDYIMVSVFTPGEFWEIEFSQEGEILVEVFKSDGTIHSNGDAIARIREMIADYNREE